MSAKYTFTAGTYYLSADCDANSNEIEFDASGGDIIIKRNGDVHFTETAQVTTTDSTNKVYWTVKDDDTIGETISGSSGSPAVSGGSFDDAIVTAVANFIIDNWEIRWAETLFISITNKNYKWFTNIDFKNCSYTNTIVIYLGASYWDTTGDCKFQYINFDNSNTLNGTGRLLFTYARHSAIDHIYMQSINTSNEGLFVGLNAGKNSTYSRIFNIRISNTNGYGVRLNDPRALSLSFEDSCTSINYQIYTDSLNQYIKNCLFDKALTGSTTIAINRGNTGTNGKLYLFPSYNIFKGYTDVFYNFESGGNKEVHLDIYNCYFEDNAQILFQNPLGHVTADYNGWENTGDAYNVAGANKIVADASLGNVPSGGVIDTTFDDYIPDGYFITNLTDYEENGSDTFDNLSIDENYYSATSKRYNPGDNITPGLQYKMCAWSSYLTIDASYAAKFVFLGGTYYLSADCDMNSNEIEFDASCADIIIKRNGDVHFTETADVSTSDFSNKVYWTVKDDDTIGETIAGSSGSPSVAGGIFDDVQNLGIVTLQNWEIRWADKQFFWHSSQNTKPIVIQYFIWKNCAYSSVIVLNLKDNYRRHSATVQYLEFDNTNSLTGSAQLIYLWHKASTTVLDHIFVEDANTSSPVIYFLSSTSCSYIRIKNAGFYGMKLIIATSFTISDSCCSIEYYNIAATLDINNCLFDAALTGYAAYAIFRVLSGSHAGVVTWNVNNCIFKGFTKVFANWEYGGDSVTYINAYNNYFEDNTQLLYGNDLGHQVADYCGYQNNGETWWTKGANKIDADAVLDTVPAGGVIDTTFDDYIPDGWFVTNLTDYEKAGSDTFDNLGIDEGDRSATGYEYNGGDLITPGLNYLMTTFSPTGVGIVLPIIQDKGIHSVIFGGQVITG